MINLCLWPSHTHLWTTSPGPAPGWGPSNLLVRVHKFLVSIILGVFFWTLHFLAPHLGSTCHRWPYQGQHSSIICTLKPTTDPNLNPRAATIVYDCNLCFKDLLSIVSYCSYITVQEDLGAGLWWGDLPPYDKTDYCEVTKTLGVWYILVFGIIFHVCRQIRLNTTHWTLKMSVMYYHCVFSCRTQFWSIHLFLCKLRSIHLQNPQSKHLVQRLMWQLSSKWWCCLQVSLQCSSAAWPWYTHTHKHTNYFTVQPVHISLK